MGRYPIYLTHALRRCSLQINVGETLTFVLLKLLHAFRALFTLSGGN